MDLSQTSHLARLNYIRVPLYTSINLKEIFMTIDRIVMMFAGLVILVSVLLSQIHHVYWLYLTAFVGANLLQSAFTGFCPLASILKAIGVKQGQAF